MGRPRKEQPEINNAPSIAEEWRPARYGAIPECIEVSNLGNIRAVGDAEVRITPPNVYCKFTQIMYSYKKNGAYRAGNAYLHLVIGNTFLSPGGMETVAHITTDYTDNSVKNLAVLTVAEYDHLHPMRTMNATRRGAGLNAIQENITLSGTTFEL